MSESVYYIEGDHVFQDMVSVVFTDDIKKSIKNQCKSKQISDKGLLGGNPDACVCFINEKSKSGKMVRATWAIFDVNKMSPGIIVHECSHLTFEMLNKRGLKHKYSTDEAYAYLNQWLFNKISEFYNLYIKEQKAIKAGKKT